MRKRISRIILIILVILLVFYLILQAYITYQERQRSAAPGNADEYNVEKLSVNPDSPLNGKNIIFLGSSVTYGAAAEGQSFVELFETLDGVHAVKEAKSGTTLADRTSWLALIAFGNGESYVTRLKKLSPSEPVDCVVCQLSTNDASLKVPLGEISDSKELSSFDAKTVTGAMEYIIRYSQDTWNCPVVFYTGSYYDSPEYAAMVTRLKALQEKWDIDVIDLYTDSAFNQVSFEQYDFWMFDPIHPTKAGYIEWWMPRMEQELTAYLTT